MSRNTSELQNSISSAFVLKFQNTAPLLAVLECRLAVALSVTCFNFGQFHVSMSDKKAVNGYVSNYVFNGNSLEFLLN